jgi:arylformamidase
MTRESRLSEEWRSWRIAKLEKEYSPSRWAKRSYSEYAARMTSTSALTRQSLGSRLTMERYGERERNILALIPPSSRSEMFIWIHGGYWQGSSIDESLMGVGELVQQGFGFASVEYSIAPGCSIDQMVIECASAITYLAEKIPTAKLYLGGHSAGAHLALSVASQYFVTGLVLVSGVFDLRPLVRTTVNDALALDENQAWHLSPIQISFPHLTKAEVLVGADESPSFNAQSQAATQYLLDNGLSASLVEVAGCDHFDILENLEHLRSFVRLAGN